MFCALFLECPRWLSAQSAPSCTHSQSFPQSLASRAASPSLLPELCQGPVPALVPWPSGSLRLIGLLCESLLSLGTEAVAASQTHPEPSTVLAQKARVPAEGLGGIPQGGFGLRSFFSDSRFWVLSSFDSGCASLNPGAATAPAFCRGPSPGLGVNMEAVLRRLRADKDPGTEVLPQPGTSPGLTFLRES